MPKTPEQRAEEVINNNFGNRLTPEEHTLAVQIAKEIFYETESKASALAEWRESVNQFAEDLHTRLSQADTAPQRAVLRFASLYLQQVAFEAATIIFNNPPESLICLERGLKHAEQFLTQGETAAWVRELVLKLYVNAGVTLGIAPFNDAERALDSYQRGLKHAEQFLTQGETAAGVRERVLNLYHNAGMTLGAAPFNDAERELQTYQRGLEHAENFLAQGKTATGVREQVLNLYDSISTIFHNSGQKGLEIQQLPALGIWSWIISFAKAEQRALMLNWQLHLQTAPAYPDFTAAFQDLLHTVLLNWHSPQHSHRHFAPTETLLAISESLYGLEQATENQRLKTVYRCLEDLDNSPIILDLNELSMKQAVLSETLDALNSLNKLSVVQKIRRWKTQFKLRKLSQQQAQLANHPYWQEQVEEVEKALVNWFMPTIYKQLPTQSSLNELSAVLLGMLLANTHVQTGNQVETILETWQHTPPWQDAETLQAIFPGDWQTWAEDTDEPILDELINFDKDNPIVRRLNISESQMYFEQPDLQKWLSELKEGEVDKLATQLKNAWENAQKQAIPLTRLFMALSDFDFHAPLFAHVQHDPDDCHLAFQSALAAVILGDAPQQVRQALQTWLQQQGTLEKNDSVFATLEAMKHRFTRAVSIYQPSHPPLKDTVHDWAKVLLREVLETESNPANILWELLERARIGLMGLTMTLPEEWDKTLGEALWNALRKTIDDIDGGYVPAENEPWLPLEIWLYQLKEWMENRPPDAETCQTHLQPNEVLIQPFFDPVNKRLRILWLAKNSLTLKELPDECALEHLWSEQTQTGIIEQWTRGLDKLKAEYRRGGNLASQAQAWEKIMDSPPVQIFANTLNTWAADFHQITVIFPAPLGQLPWESLPQLENKLVREISVAHWLKSSAVGFRSAPTHPTLTTLTTLTDEESLAPWVVCDPSGEAQCMRKEGHWVAHHLKTELNAPCPSIFDALYQLEHSNHAHLSTHGIYYRDNPTRSYLSLEDDKKIQLPLWLNSAVRTQAELVMLSACESNLSGQDTEGLLTPLGIGPSLAAAGAKTVVGTLWPCDGVAATCFTYHFYTIATENESLPWHQVVSQARRKLQEMTTSDLKKLAEKLNLNDQEDECCFSVEHYKWQTVSDYPFEGHVFWAGFTVLGRVARKK